MKTEEQKYKEAVERNVRGLKKAKYKNMSFADIKMRLGIRKTDGTYDEEIRAVAKKPEKKKSEEASE